MIVNGCPVESTWETHVRAFMENCFMDREEAVQTADNYASLGLIIVTDRRDKYKDAHIPEDMVIW